MDTKVAKFEWVDALRGIAVLGVVLLHAGQFGVGKAGLPLKLSAFIGDGARGVQLFYIMSAFTLFYTYSHHSQREVCKLRNFFTRRFFRIAPLFYIVIVYFFVIDGRGSRYPGVDATIDFFTVVSTLTFTNGFNPHWINTLVPGGWSIAVEMAFYCLVPFLFARVTTLGRWIAAFAVSLLIKGVFYYCSSYLLALHPTREWLEFSFFCLPAQIPVFMLGILLYLVLCKNCFGAIGAKGWGAVCAVAAMLFFVSRYYKGLFDCFDPELLGFGLFFLLLAYSLSRIPVLFRISKLLAPIGKISYSMYLLHFTALCWLAKFHWLDFFPSHNKYVASVNFALRFAISLAVTAGLSYLTYRCIEKPFIALGGRLIKIREEPLRRRTEELCGDPVVPVAGRSPF